MRFALYGRYPACFDAMVPLGSYIVDTLRIISSHRHSRGT